MTGVCNRAVDKGTRTNQPGGKSGQAADSPFLGSSGDRLGLLVGDSQVLQSILERLLLAILLLITFFLLSHRGALVFVVRWLILEVKLTVREERSVTLTSHAPGPSRERLTGS